MIMSRIWFTSDNHFGHARITKLCPETRPVHPNELDDTMIDVWNATIAPDDIVYCLGDFSFYNANRTKAILHSLNGQIHLMVGNHDQWLNSNTIRMLASVNNYREIVIGDQMLVLCHYPLYEWNKMHHGAWHLYGHVHGSVDIPGKALDVGIDNRPQGDMKPWSIEEVAAYMEKRKLRIHNMQKMDM